MSNPNPKAVLPDSLKDWGSYWQIYDTCCIGTTADPKVNGWFQSFTEMANAPEIPFLNVRNLSEAGQTYTNITTKGKMPWWFDLNSIGLRFLFPDPAVNVGSEHLGLTTMAKQFMTLLPEHAVFHFDIRSYRFLSVKCTHLPAGFGPQGYFDMGVGQNTGFTSLINNGIEKMDNRWKFLNNERIPYDTPIMAKIELDDFAKSMLRLWDTVPGIDFGEEDLFANMPQIELTLRGIRYEQRPGEFRQ